jgi:hypothetical protein
MLSLVRGLLLRSIKLMPSAEYIKRLLLVFAVASEEERLALADQLVHGVIRPGYFAAVDDTGFGPGGNVDFEPRLSADAVLNLHQITHDSAL